MRGALALILIAGGALLAYAVASGRFPSSSSSASSAASAGAANTVTGGTPGSPHQPAPLPTSTSAGSGVGVFGPPSAVRGGKQGVF